jgi:hypothetical protein
MMMQLNGYKGNNMSLGGGSSSQQGLDPAFRDLFTSNYQGAKDVASGLTARQFAGFTPEQLTAFQTTGKFANPNDETFQGMRNAYTEASQAARYAPQNVGGANLNRADIRNVANQAATAGQVNRAGIRDLVSADIASQGVNDIASLARGAIQDITPGSFLNQNIQSYMSPYTKNVIDVSTADLERARQQARTVDAAKAAAARAFGGSRQGVAEAETNRAYDENTARMIAQQNAAAYDAATRLSEADLSRSMQAQLANQGVDAATVSQGLQLAGQLGMANQGVDLSAMTTNAQLQNAVAMANQEANLRAQLANQGIDLSTGQLNTQNAQQAALANQAAGLSANQQRINAANQMANISSTGQQMGLTGAKALADVGAIQQGLTQAQMDAIRNLPLEQQQILNQALGINVGGGSGATSTSTSRQGLLGLLGIG